MGDLTITAAQVLPGSDAQRISRPCTVAVAAGQAVYLDGNNQWALADANVSAAAAAAIGIAINSAAAGQPAEVVTEGTVTLGAGAAPAAGQIFCVSVNAGGIAPYGDLLSTNYVTILGIGIGTNQIRVGVTASGIQKA